MLSDESSSDSETGRFKCQSKPKEEQSSRHKDGDFRGKGRQNDRFHRDFGRQRNERLDYDKHSRDRHRDSRNSPVNRRKYSRERTPRRRSPERHRDRDSKAKSRHHRSASKEKRNSLTRSHKSPESRSRTHKSPEPKPRIQKSPDPTVKTQRSPEPKRRMRSPEQRSISHKSAEPRARQRKSPDIKIRSFKSPEPRRDMKEEIRHTLEQRKSPLKARISEERVSLSPDYRGKRSEVYRPPPNVPSKRKSDSPIIVEEHDSDKSEEVQVGSYYKMIPTVVKEKSEEESSEIDSSDDERLRAKLLNLEKELQKTKKRKHKKKHKRKSKTSKERDEAATSVEVTSTTDIDVKELKSKKNSPLPEVSSTQKSVSKESSEEGEISSGDDTHHSIQEYDASDLRHKLSRKPAMTSKTDVCGPVLPPHLENKCSTSVNREGPALPPHLSKSKNIGPTIPDNMRIVLAEKDYREIEYESSDDDGIGPLPVGAESKWSEAHQRLEERALDIKIRTLDGHSMDSHKIKNREEWMLELPEGKTKYLGLEARSFRPKEGPDMSDRSSWTDTPEQKAMKAAGIHREEDADEAIRRDARARLINNRDEEQEMAVKKHKKKHRRDESLLEQHERKLKKKKKKEEKDNDGKAERRPFSRDVDLQVNRFDEAQKKSIIKKAQGLNTRFSRGEAKYL